MTLPSAFTVAQSIDEAFERSLIDPKGITPEHVASARRSIRLMLDSWNNDSVMFWKVGAGQTQALAIGDDSFTLVAGAIDILQAAILRSGAYIPVSIISQSQWFAIPDRDATTQVQGLPRLCWVERTITGATAHIYPAADLATDVFVYDVMLQFNDSSQLSAQADVPGRWNNAFVSGLTAFLSEKFNHALFAEKMAKYGGPGVTNRPGQPPSDYQIARMGDRERGDTVMTIARRRR
jgi:hypothetical protein